MRGLAVCGALAMLLPACAPAAPATPEAAVRALSEAARAGDAAAFRGGFPSREEIAELFACPPDVDLAARYEGLLAELSAWRQATALPGPSALSEALRVPVAVGEPVGACTAKRTMTLIRADVRVGDGADQLYAMRFVDVDGRVRVLGY